MIATSLSRIAIAIAIVTVTVSVSASATAMADADKPFAIQVVDDATGRGVPMTELTTTHNLRLITDSQGFAAFREPGLMDQDVHFAVKSHGYEFPKDGFGFRGKTLKTVPGGKAILKIKRINIAERLYRITGAGIDRDSVLLGQSVPIRQPLLNAQVFGSDSAEAVVFQGKIHWIWGDTNFPRYPLGLFHTPAATSNLPERGGLDPDVGIDLEYFVDAEGRARASAELPGPGPTWLSGLIVLKNKEGQERLFAHYVKIKPPMTAYERGLVEFDPRSKTFRKLATFPDRPIFPHGGFAQLHKDQDETYIVYSDPYPRIRVKADPESLADLARYQAWTCAAEGGRVADGPAKTADGQARWAWRSNADPVDPATQAQWIKSGRLAAEDGWMAIRDVETGKTVLGHRGSAAWNAYRGRFVMIFCELFGTSPLGEIWFAEADRMQGPWVWARKIVTHDRYSFYNPKHHPFFDRDGGRQIYFEGTYTNSFSGNSEATPLYEYNQMLYRLDLSDPRLNLPAPIRRNNATGELRPKPRSDKLEGPIAFWALERPSAESRPARLVIANGAARLRIGGDNDRDDPPAFHVLPADLPNPPSSTVPLYEYRGPSGQVRYEAGTAPPAIPGFQRSDAPIARVWPHPLRPSLEYDGSN